MIRRHFGVPEQKNLKTNESFVSPKYRHAVLLTAYSIAEYLIYLYCVTEK